MVNRMYLVDLNFSENHQFKYIVLESMLYAKRAWLRERYASLYEENIRFYLSENLCVPRKIENIEF